MEIEDDSNMELKSMEFVIRSSISVNLENLDFNRSEDALLTIIDDMWSTLISFNKSKQGNYLGIWIKYDGEILDNAIKIQTLEDIKKYSLDDINEVYEFVKMTLPD